jgi:hypothetical protein
MDRVMRLIISPYLSMLAILLRGTVIKGWRFQQLID